MPSKSISVSANSRLEYTVKEDYQQSYKLSGLCEMVDVDISKWTSGPNRFVC